MTQFSTELLNFLAQKQDIDEFFRSSLETAMNDLLPISPLGIERNVPPMRMWK